VTFSVNNRTDLTQGGLYLTDDFAQSGSHFGGPAVFHGSAVLFEISGGAIRFEFRENNGQIDFTNASIIPHLTIDLASEIFAVKIEFSTFRVLRISTTINDQNMMIFYGKAREDLAKTWLSIVATSPDPATEFMVLGANLSFADEPPTIRPEPPTITPSEFDPSSGLEHREFQQLSRVLVSSRGDTDIYADTNFVFEAIRELDRVLNATATFGPTKKAIARITANITDSWKRRSLKMVDETHTINRALAGETESLTFRVRMFRTGITHRLGELRDGTERWADSAAKAFAAAAEIAFELPPRRYAMERIPALLLVVALFEALLVMAIVVGLLLAGGL
jgi:hypothetical protein